MKNTNDFPSKAAVERVRAAYPSGCRVELISMDDPIRQTKTRRTGNCSLHRFHRHGFRRLGLRFRSRHRIRR